MIRRKTILAAAGAMMLASAFADTQTVNGVTWTYTVTTNGEAIIERGGEQWQRAVEPEPVGALVIPSELGGCPVTGIGYCAFVGCGRMTSVTIPSSVRTIGNSAFQNCSGLTSVDIPDGVTSIGSQAFCSCYGLTSVSIPSSVTEIGTSAFYYCTGLTSVTIPEGVTHLSAQVFCGCSGLTSVKIPSNVTSIVGSAFLCCTGLMSIEVDEANAFYCSEDGLLLDKAKTTLVAYPGGRRDEAMIPTNVTCIGSCAFWGASLSSVKIPSSVTSIGSEAFAQCDGLVSFAVDESNEAYCSVDGLLFDKAKTTLVACPGGRQGAVTVLPSVERIGDAAFSGCRAVTAVTIPKGVASIGYSAFRDCSSLSAVRYAGDAPECVWDWEIYSGAWNVTSYVLVGTKGWNGDPESSDVPDAWPVGDEHARPIVALDPSVKHTVAFDLGEHGMRTGGGALSQDVGESSAAVAPEIVADDGWEFTGWDADFSFVIDDMTVCAQYRKDGSSDLAPQMALVLQIEEGVIVGHSHVDGDGGCVTNGVLMIPAGVTSIGECALESAEEIEEVVIPASVRSIGDYAFGWCANLRKVTFADRAGCAVSESAFVGTPWQLAQKLTFGPGKISTFTMGGTCSLATERAVIAGVAGAVWEDFAEVVYRGNGYDEVNTYQSLTCDGIIDVEKTAATDADDYSCWELPKINMAYWGGYVSKDDYPTEDAVADAYRANGCWDDVFAWLEVPTNRIDWSYSNGSAADFNEFIVRHLKDGNAHVELWTSMAGHGITCCGYVCDESLELWEPGYLTGLFIVDSDNDMFANGGAAAAPNRIAYCPVRWVEEDDECSGCYMIGNVWGLEWDEVYVENALWAKGAPVAEKIYIPFGYELRDATVTGFHGDLPAQIVLPRETESVGESAFDADYREVGALVSAALPEGVTNICQYAFWFCENLTTLALPASLESVADCSFTFCTALRTVYVTPGDTERIRNMLSESAYKYTDDGRISTIDVSKLTFIEGEHPDLTAARLEWAKDDAIEAIEAAANDLARDQSGWNAALTAIVKDAEAAVMAATTPEAAEAAGLAGVARVKAFVNEVASKVTGAIANFELYEDVWIGFRRITAVGSEVWVEVLENGTCTAELSLGDWQVTVEARRKSDGAFYTVTESLTVTDGAATFDLVLPADEYLGNAAVDLSEAGQYADVGVGGLSAVARKSAEAEGKSVTYELKVADPELLIEREEKPVLRMMASARAVQASANVSAASIAAMRAAVDGLRQTAETVIADINRRVNILSIALSRSDDGGRTWSDVEALEDETVEVSIPLELDTKADFAILRSDGHEVESVLRSVDNGLNASSTGADESFRVEPGKVVMKISKFAVFAVVSGAPRERLYPDGDGAYVVPTAAVSYEGVLLRDGAVAGTVSASVSKPNARKGSVANITLKVKTIEKASYAFAAKKVPLPDYDGQFVLEPSNKKSASLGAATVVFGGDSLTGSFANGFEIDAVRDVFKEKGNEKRDRISRYVQNGRSWCIALSTDAAELGYATLGVKVSANGKVSVTGYMGDGVKLSTSAKAEIGQGWLAVPVVMYKKSGKTVKTFGCRVSLDEQSGKVGIANATPYAGSGFVLAASGLPELKKAELKVATLSVSAGEALSSTPDAVKLTYNEKSGAIGGTATWFNAGGKKKLTGKVYGVAIGRQGFGEVVVKNVGTFRFTLVFEE